MAVNEADLQALVSEFQREARPKQNDPTAPATVAELNHVVTELSRTLEQLVSKLVQ